MSWIFLAGLIWSAVLLYQTSCKKTKLFARPEYKNAVEEFCCYCLCKVTIRLHDTQQWLSDWNEQAERKMRECFQSRLGALHQFGHYQMAVMNQVHKGKKYRALYLSEESRQVIKEAVQLDTDYVNAGAFFLIFGALFFLWEGNAIIGSLL